VEGGGGRGRGSVPPRLERANGSVRVSSFSADESQRGKGRRCGGTHRKRDRNGRNLDASEVQLLEAGVSRERFAARSAPPLPDSHSLHTAQRCTQKQTQALSTRTSTREEEGGGEGEGHRTAMHTKLIREWQSRGGRQEGEVQRR